MLRKNDHISLEFISHLKFTAFGVFVLTYLRNTLSIDEDTFFKIEMALREVINNAILHGNKSDPNKNVQVRFDWKRDFLRITVRDESEEKVDFDAINKKLKKSKILSFNGRGLLIMKSYMDKVEFYPSKNGSKIVLEKYL